MAYEYMLDALDETKTWITAKLEAALVAIETARSLTALSIPRWTGITTSLNLSDQYPYIELLPDNTDPSYGEGESPYSEEHWNFHSISVLTSHASYDQADLQLVLMYYAEAMERVIKVDYTFGDIFNTVRLGQSNYSLLISAQEDKLIKQTIEQTFEIRAFNS